MAGPGPLLAAALLALLLAALPAAAETPAAPNGATGDTDFAAASRSWTASDYTVEKLTPYAEKGSVRAQTMLGYLFQRGTGVAANAERAAFWFGRAAVVNYHPAEYALARLYHDGYGGQNGRGQILPLMRRAAEGGYPLAQVDLGLMYAEGKEAPRDPATAVEWFRKAADQDFASGEYALALALIEGRGIAPNPEQGLAWAIKAAEQDHGPAQYLAGVSLLRGIGAKPDPVAGMAWIILAARNNAPGAGEGLQALHKDAPADIRRAAEDKASTFTPRVQRKPAG
jgi:hypothetical protein